MRFKRIVEVMQENDIIQKVLDGDTNAYENLVNRYSTGLIIYCERMLGERPIAEDIAQEAFMKAFTELRKFNPQKARFSTWLYKIATNRAYDYLRQQKSTLPSEDIDELAEESAPDFDDEEQCRMIRATVKHLQPETYRKVIEAYYWQGKSYEEIAASMGVPINTVRTWLRRAKEQLRKELV